MDFVSMIGFAAGALTTIAFIPQVLHTWRSRSGKDLSYGMLLVFAAGVVLWLLYGFYLRALPVIVANTTTLVLVLAIVVMKFRFARRTSQN